MTWPEKYLRIPFVDRGESWQGCDCWGLLKLILREQLGKEISSHSDIQPGDLRQKVRAIVKGADSDPEWARVAAGEEAAFDCVLMRGQISVDGRMYSRPVHVGAVVRPGLLIHIEAGAGVTVVNYREHPRVKGRVISFHRLRDAS